MKELPFEFELLWDVKTKGELFIMLREMEADLNDLKDTIKHYDVKED